MKLSPNAHIYRLLGVVAIALVVLWGLKQWAVPASWSHSGWYRQEALPELKAQPLQFGGNQSCNGASCHTAPQHHRENYELLRQNQHQGLACETCHGMLALHVADGKKIANASINKGNNLCMNCHQSLLGKPANFSQFKEDLLQHKLLQVTAESSCHSCHNPHDPK